MTCQITDLHKASKKVNIVVKLIAKSPPRYAKGYKVVTFTAGDPTGTILIPFWNNDAEVVKVGDYLEIDNGYVTEFRNRLQLNIGRYGCFHHVKLQDGFEVSESPAVGGEGDPGSYIPIEYLEQQMKNLTLAVLVKEKVNDRIVKTRRDGKEHRIVTFLVGDRTGCILLDLWDDLSQLIQVGESYRIQKAYVRTFRGQRVQNISRYGRITPYTQEIQFNGMNNLSEMSATES